MHADNQYVNSDSVPLVTIHAGGISPAGDSEMLSFIAFPTFQDGVQTCWGLNDFVSMRMVLGERQSVWVKNDDPPVPELERAVRQFIPDHKIESAIEWKKRRKH